MCTFIDIYASIYIAGRGIMFSTCPIIHSFVGYQTCKHDILKTTASI